MSPQQAETDPLPSSAPETEEQVRQDQKLRAMGLMTSGIAHDFNNLLTVINGYNEMVLMTCDLPEEARKCLAISRGAGERAAALVRGLLTFSRRQSPGKELVDLNESTAELVQLLGRLLPSNIRITTALEPNLKTALANSGEIQQVLLNLVMNSRDAMPTGGEIEISTRNLASADAASVSHPELPAGDYVVLSVRDNGAGMDEAAREQSFTPFYTTKSAAGGTGLGLSTVRQLVQGSGGFLSVQSAPDAGTVVRFYLPCAAGAKKKSSAEWQRKARGGTETVLIAEDNAALRDLLRRQLDGLGYRVLSAGSIAEAMELSRGTAIDLVVADLALPDGTGAALAADLGEEHPRLPVLHITGYCDDEELGLEVLTKPFSLAAFGERVRSVLDRRAKRRILIVDDDAELVMFASRVLRDAGFEVLVGGNGNIALTTAGAEHLDLVITDLVMPEREGLETIMRLRKSHPALPVIAISGAFGGHFLKGASALGASVTLAKPFSGDDLLSAVDSVLH